MARREHLPNQRQLSNQMRPKLLDLHESRYRRVISVLRGERKGILLDVGCGDGAFSELLLRMGWRVVAIEAYEVNARLAIVKGVTCITCDASMPLPLKDEKFDVVFAGEILEHIVDTDLFLAELSRVLKPGGTLLMTTPNLASLENRIRLLVGAYPKWMDYSVMQGEGHVRYYTLAVLERQLTRHNFELVSVQGNFVPLLPQRVLDDHRIWPLTILGKAWPTLSQAFIVHAKKPYPVESHET